MTDEAKITKIKEIAEEFFQKMTIVPVELAAAFLPAEPAADGLDAPKKLDVIDISATFQEPQFLIGQNGQTLFELERILRMVLNKKLQENFYVTLDINNYKSKKVEYLRLLAKDSANEAAVSGVKKMLPPMSAYERRIIHKELDGRKDVVVQSEGDGEQRHIVISPANSL